MGRWGLRLGDLRLASGLLLKGFFRGGGGAFAHEEAGGHADGFGLFTADDGIQHIHGGDTHALFGLADRGEGDAEEA